MSLTRKIEQEELEALEGYFSSIYPDSYLISHGLDHHRRVWKYAKELVDGTEIRLPHSASYFFKLMTACYLHDTGMVVESGINHGIHSRKYCEDYLAGKGLDPAGYADLLDAIELHDDKDYTRPVQDNPVYEVLTLSDDLDAFGYTGILRYTEIYTERGSSLQILASQIAENAVNRFRNFKNSRLPDKKILERHTARFNILIDFCSGLNCELINTETGKESYSGYKGITELIKTKGGKLSKKDILVSLSADFRNDKIVHGFLTGLAGEL